MKSLAALEGFFKGFTASLRTATLPLSKPFAIIAEPPERE